MSKHRKKETAERLWPDDGLSMEPLGEELGWAKVYWTVGPAPRTSLRNDVTDPPNAGWSHAFVLPAPGRSVRLLCPCTLMGFDVSEDSFEFASLTVPKRPLNREWAAETVTENWVANRRYGFSRDYDTAARVLRGLGAAVPIVDAATLSSKAALDGAGVLQPQKKARGKGAAERLTKPVPRKGRRGEVLAWFMDEFGPRSIREGMAEFDVTRSNFLTVLFMLHKEHGIGYSVDGDAAELEFPKAGCKKLFC